MTRNQTRLESSLEDYFQRSVRQRGGRALKLIPVVKGIPDRLVLWPGGRAVFVELKTETGTVSPKQRHEHDKLRGLGYQVEVLFGMADLDRWLRRYPKLTDRPGAPTAQR